MRSGISAIAVTERRLFHWQSALAVALALAAIGAGAALGDDTIDQAVLIARYTARVSLGFFTIVYISGPLWRGWPTPRTQALDAQWGYWLMAFLIAHLIHFAAMMILFATKEVDQRLHVLAVGPFVYLVPLIMVLTLRRGDETWQKWLRRISLHLVWISFAATYYRRLWSHPDRRAAGVFAFVLLTGMLAVRLAAAVKTKRWWPKD